MTLRPAPHPAARRKVDGMGKLLGDNRVVGAAFVFLVVLNALAIQLGWY